MFLVNTGVAESTERLFEERKLASQLNGLALSQLKYIQKLVVVASLLERLNYADEDIARLLSELHNAPGQHLGFGINFGFLRQLRECNFQQSGQGDTRTLTQTA